MHYSEEDFILHHYGEHGDSAAIAEHVKHCEPCREQMLLIRRVLGAVDRNTLPVPARGDQYGTEVWNRLRPRLPAERTSWTSRLFPGWQAWPQWAAAGAFAVLLIAAFIAGRYSPREGTAPTAPTPAMAAAPAPEQIRERVLLVAVGDHLDRSQMVLAELVNALPESKAARAPVDISNEQQWARELVASNRLYRQTAAQTGESNVESVLDELEPILLEIAHSPSSMTAAALDELRERIEAQGLLFKIRIVGSNVRQRERVTTPVRASNPVS
jgi:hypothetical protein